MSHTRCQQSQGEGTLTKAWGQDEHTRELKMKKSVALKVAFTFVQSNPYYHTLSVLY